MLISWQDANFVWQDYTNFLRNLHEKRVQFSAEKNAFVPKQMAAVTSAALRTALWFFFDTVYRYVLYYSAFERNYWHKWTMIPGYKFPRKKWTTFTMDELREDKALSSPSLKWIKNLALPLPSHHCVDKRLSKNIMDWSHSWVTSLEEEQPSWIGLSIMWGQSFREFSWRFL